MADYVLPGAVEKRVRFFDGQFLQDQDFVDEQDYQLDREHRHNRLLHGPGVADGLTVTSAAANQATVAPGTAIDADGNQLVLAQPTNVDLPAADFNDKQGVQIFIVYQVTATDQQTVGGSSDFTRWLERPQLVALAPGNPYSGTASPVLLANVALDNSGRVTVDNTARTYTGLRLPGPGADAATLQATSGGLLHLAGGLIVDGSVGIGTMNPAHDLEIGSYQAQDRFLTFKVQGGNAHVSGVNMWSWQDNYGYSLRFDERMASPNGLHFKSHNQDPVGVSRMFVDWFTGNVGIGTTTPGARLEVDGGGGLSIDLKVNGRLQSNSNDGGMWVSSDRFVGGFGSNIGFWNNGAWRLVVQNDGHVGLGTNTPGFPLHIAGGKAVRVDAGVNATDDTVYFSFGGNGAFGIDAPGVPNGRFKVDNSGNVGIGAPNPAHDLEIGSYQAQDRFLTFKVQGGNAHVSGVNMWSWQDNYGYSLRFDERMASPNGLHFKSHNQDPVGVSRMFVDWFTGNVGIGTTTPGGRLNVVGGGGTSVDFIVNGRMRSDNNDGGLWVTSDRFVGGFGTDNIGFWSNGAWRMWVMNNGQVVTQSDLFVSGHLNYADGGGNWWHIHPSQAPFFGGWIAANDGIGGPSDLRLKTDVRPVTNALDLIGQLQAVRYQWAEHGLSHFTKPIDTGLSAGPDATDEQHQQVRDAERGKALDALAGDRFGLIAQDVEAVLPELVRDDEDGYKHIRYEHLTALLAEAIKEQDAVVRALSAEVAALRAAGQEGSRS